MRSPQSVTRGAMSSPERPSREQLSTEERRRVVRAAFLRRISLFVVTIGGISFALTLSWWVVAVTLATYAALVFLAARDPLFWTHVLEGREYRLETRPAPSDDGKSIPPERRVLRLPSGETRQKVEEALEFHRRTMIAIEESDDITKRVLDDAVPKLHGIAERLVVVAERRAELAEAKRGPDNRARAPHCENRNLEPARLKDELRAADAGIAQTVEKLSTLRARVVRISVESGGTAQDAAAKLNADLDDMNLWLDALHSTISPEHHNW